MKPALLEVMRMNRICRMVLATCLGSFILVIFYFQSMLHPGRGRVSVVLLDIFFSLVRSLCLVSTSFNLTSSPLASLGFLLPRSAQATGQLVRTGWRRGALLFLLRAQGWRMGPGLVAVVLFFFSPFFFFFVCLSAKYLREMFWRSGEAPRAGGLV